MFAQGSWVCHITNISVICDAACYRKGRKKLKNIEKQSNFATRATHRFNKKMKKMQLSNKTKE